MTLLGSRIRYKVFESKNNMIRPDFSLENQLHHPHIAGVDEVGYGAWSGPVVVAAVVCCPQAMSPDFLSQIHDSKKMSPVQRETVFRTFMSHPEMGQSAIDYVTVEDMNRGCVLRCTLHAMAHAVQAVGAKAVLVDGCHPIPLDIMQKSIPRGDGKSVSIALASIIAKVVRDREMVRLSVQHPLFHWDQNKGYGTLLHRKAIAKNGLTSHHRKVYCRRVLEKGL